MWHIISFTKKKSKTKTKHFTWHSFENNSFNTHTERHSNYSNQNKNLKELKKENYPTQKDYKTILLKLNWYLFILEFCKLKIIENDHRWTMVHARAFDWFILTNYMIITFFCWQSILLNSPRVLYEIGWLFMANLVPILMICCFRFTIMDAYKAQHAHNTLTRQCYVVYHRA